MRSTRARPFASAVTALALVTVLTACDSFSAGPLQPSSTAQPAPPTATVTVTSPPAPAPAQPTVTVTTTTTESAPPSTTTTETTTEAPPPPPETPESEPDPAPPGSPDPEIHAAVEGAFNRVNTYWVNVFAGWHGNYGEPIYWEIPRRFNGDGFYDSTRDFYSYCAGEPAPAINAGFCHDIFKSGTVSWDAEFLRREARIGDGPLYVTVAHEVGHAAQARFIDDGEGGATPPRETAEYELQADCLAGAALGKAVQDGYLTLGSGALDDIKDAMLEFNRDGGDHGSDADRITFFMRGYNSADLESCLYNQGVPPTT